MPGSYFGGGGGHSRLFTVAQAPWEREVGVSGRPERKPDIAALAGSPDYLQGGYGTSAASPLMAGATADLDEYLAHKHAKPIGPLNPTLYRVASKPNLYPQVFNDIVDGTNDLLGLGCCTAGPGYDEASGLGSLNVWGLAGTLLAHPKLRVPWTTLALSASESITLDRETIDASTNNVVRGTPYFINIYIRGKFLRRCKRSSCRVKIKPRDGDVEADVGPRHAKPFRKQAIVSKKAKVSVHVTLPHCHGSTCM